MGWVIYNGQGVPIVSEVSHPPKCEMFHSVGQNIASGGAGQAVVFDSEVSDTDGMHSVVVNTSRVTAVTAGSYLFTGVVTWPASVVGERAVWLRRTSAGPVVEYLAGQWDSANAVGAARHMQTVTWTIYLAVGDYVELWAYQTSGGILGLLASNAVNINPLSMTATWVAP